MNRFIYFVACVLVSITGLPANAEQPHVAEVDKYLAECYERLRKATPGFAVAVVDHNRIAFAKGYGVEVAGSDQPFSADSTCPVGSLTKSLTALAVMQLSESDKLRRDAPVTRYLPWFRTADHKRSDRITVRMLLSHTSGLPSRDEWITSEAPAEQAMEQVIRAFSARRTSHEPGGSFEYANEGYTIAGLIMQQVTGRSYCSYMQQAVLDPLQMKRSAMDENRLSQMGALAGHSAGIDRAIPGRLPYLAAGVPAGAAFASTVTDIGHYLIALMNHGRFCDAQILSQEGIEQMLAPAVDFPCPITLDDGGDGGTWHYGLGWMMANIDGREVVFHEGDTGLAGSIAMIDWAKSLAVCIIRNSSDVDPYRYPTIGTMANNVLHLAASQDLSDYGIPRKPDLTLNEYLPPRGVLQECIGRYISQDGPGRIEIAEYPKGDGLWANTMGTFVPIQEIVDFRDESLVVFRSVHGGRRGHFRKLPNGKVIGLQLGGDRYRKSTTSVPDGYQLVRSPDALPVVLPQGWSVAWDGPNFTAVDPVDPRISVHGGTALGEDRSADTLGNICDRNTTVVEQGPVISAAISGLIWHQQSALVEQDGERRQRMTVYTRLRDRIFFVVLVTPHSSLTSQAQRVIAPLISAYAMANP